MDRPSYMPAEGSMAAHDELRAAVTLFRLAEQAVEADWTDLQRIRDADRCWFEVGMHALNCGATGAEPNLEEWVMRRLSNCTWQREAGVTPSVGSVGR